MTDKQHRNESQAYQDFIKLTEKATVKSGPWMGLFIRVNDQGDILIDRTTWKYPLDKIPATIGELGIQLGKLVKPVQPDTSELPQADPAELAALRKVIPGFGIVSDEEDANRELLEAQAEQDQIEKDYQ